jgi:hypothetical protein
MRGHNSGPFPGGLVRSDKANKAVKYGRFFWWRGLNIGGCLCWGPVDELRFDCEGCRIGLRGAVVLFGDDAPPIADQPRAYNVYRSALPFMFFIRLSTSSRRSCQDARPAERRFIMDTKET